MFMNKRIIEILELEGWYDRRKIDLEHEILTLKREGFLLPDEKLKILLEEFWNLNIEFILPDGRNSNIEFNIETAVQQIDAFVLQKYEVALSKKIIPVGCLHFQSGLVLVSYDFAFYFLTGRNLYKIANSFIEFLDVVINQKEIFKVSNVID